MLGSLARMLRILGYKVIYGRYDDEDLIELAESMKAILLTRDVELSKRTSRAILLSSSRLEDQLLEVLPKLPSPPEEPFSICPLCGSLLIEAEREAIKGKVYEPVYSMNEVFYLCPNCGQIYWKGSQFKALKERLSKIFSKVGSGFHFAP